jgi:hypothetical protein
LQRPPHIGLELFDVAIEALNLDETIGVDRHHLERAALSHVRVPMTTARPQLVEHRALL